MRSSECGGMASRTDPAVVDIVPSQGWVALRTRDLWEYRELLYFLVWRDLKVRYRQTALGAAWAVLQPVLTMAIFAVFFGRLAGMPSDGVPYPLFAFAALVPWTFFAQGLTLSSNSLVANQALLRKVYFPRLVIPVATVASNVADFAIAFMVLLAMLAWYQVSPTADVAWVLPLFALGLVTALGTGLWLSALNVLYRDVQYVVPFLLQVWMFSTPIVYPSSLIPGGWRLAYAINPMVGVVEGFRWALLGASVAPWPVVAVSTASAVVLLLTGLLFFRRMERTFSDVV